MYSDNPFEEFRVVYAILLAYNLSNCQKVEHYFPQTWFIPKATHNIIGKIEATSATNLKTYLQVSFGRDTKTVGPFYLVCQGK